MIKKVLASLELVQASVHSGSARPSKCTCLHMIIADQADGLLTENGILHPIHLFL